MQNTLIIIHVVISAILILVVLLQHGKQQGLSGAIAGGAETFFGKNKGRTIDSVLNKITTVVATLFVISAIALTFVSVKDNGADAEALPADAAGAVEVDPAALEDAVVVDDAAVAEGEEAVEGAEATEDAEAAEGAEATEAAEGAEEAETAETAENAEAAEQE